MPRTGPTTLSLPPFEGATRKLILWNVVPFFAFVVLGTIAPRQTSAIASHLMLIPEAAARGQLWQVVTYAFMPLGVLSMIFAMLTLWICGAMLEGERGSRWLYELYFTSVVGGAILAAAISFTQIFQLSPLDFAAGCYAGIFGLLVGIAMYFGDQEFLLFFLIRVKAKYMVAIYILIELALLLTGSNRFDALVQLAGGLCGYLFLRYAGKKGFGFSVTERYYALRNQYYRAKRRNAARKFEVYMGKQGREVHFDKNGKYIDPDGNPGKDPNDKRWMN